MKKNLTLLIVLISFQLHATHLRSGFITTERDNCSSRTYKITVTVFTNTGSSVLFGGAQEILNFGDGTQILVPETPNTPIAGVPGMGMASFSVFHTFNSLGKFTISYIEPNRNAGVLNIQNSIGTTFYLETQIDAAICNRSPILQVPPTNQACVGAAYYYNPGASDSDGDSLSYEFVVPYRDRDTEVMGYTLVTDPSFYSDFSHGNEAGNGPPTIIINSEGTIIWDAPSLPSGLDEGEYSVAFEINEWRKINEQWTNIGFIRMDMQIIVLDCPNAPPMLILPENFCVEAGTMINTTIVGNDPENNNVKIELLSQILDSGFPSPANFQPDPAVFQPSPAEVNFTWNTACDHVQVEPYSVTFKATDDSPLGSDPSTLKTLKIRVIAPSPSIQAPIVNIPKRTVQLSWNAYTCGNASKIKIFRKIGDSGFTPSACDTGVPDTLGFRFIAQISNQDELGNFVTSYTDREFGEGISVGVKYCYRIVAEFESSENTSYASEEVCIDPIPVTVPMVTNVSVEKTGDVDGVIKIRWTKPFDIDEGQYPPPYEYIVQQFEESGYTNVSAKISDTTFTHTGLNTRNNSYFYRVILFSSSAPTAIDTSSVAASIKLDLVAGSKIHLLLFTDVPWSYRSESFPWQRIYKGLEGATEETLTLIDSIHSLQPLHYNYIDTDDSNAPGEIYCYRVMTRGSYENPNIPEPLINYSPIKCGYILSISDESDDNIQLFPNPTHQFLKIEFTDQDVHEIRFYDQSGRVHFTRIERGNAMLDLGALTNGQYICEIRSSRFGVKRVRIIKN